MFDTLDIIIDEAVIMNTLHFRTPIFLQHLF